MTGKKGWKNKQTKDEVNWNELKRPIHASILLFNAQHNNHTIPSDCFNSSLVV